MRRTKLIIALIAFCAMALFAGAVTVAAAADTTTTTTATTAAGGSTTTTASGESTTTTASTESTTTTTESDWWRVVSVDMTESGLSPTFVSVGEGFVAWTGKTPNGYSSMNIYDVPTGTSTKIPEPLPGNYYNPSADGSQVVYQGGGVGRYEDIFIYDSTNGMVRQLTHNSDPGDGNDWNPRLDGGRVVWEKHMLGIMAKSGIYVFDMNKGTVARVLEGEKYRDPDIWGDYVVCVKDAETGNTSEVILYSLKTGEAKSIAPADKNNVHPRIDDGRVVWSSGDAPTLIYYPWDTYQILVYDIAQDRVEVWTDNTAGNVNPSIGGGVVAWEQIEPLGIGANDYKNHAKGTFSPDENVKAPDCTEGGAAWHSDTSLYYATRYDMGPAFPDVGEKYPYSRAIKAMKDAGIIAGYDNGTFGPYDPVTRQQFAKFILLTMAQSNPAVYTPTLRDDCYFLDNNDIERSEGELYAYHFVARATSTRLIYGYPGGYFRPLGNITRQQVITMIVRAGSSLIETPPAGWQGVLSYVDPEHGEGIRSAEYNGLTDGLVGGVLGGLTGWDTRLKATRGEVAQMLYNLLKMIGEEG